MDYRPFLHKAFGPERSYPVVSFNGRRGVIWYRLDGIEGPFLEQDESGHCIGWGIRDALSRLNQRERLVLVRRYGLLGCKWTLKELGDRHGVSRERIRQIEAKAIRRLGFYAKNGPLRGFLRQVGRAEVALVLSGQTDEPRVEWDPAPRSPSPTYARFEREFEEYRLYCWRGELRSRGYAAADVVTVSLVGWYPTTLLGVLRALFGGPPTTGIGSFDGLYRQGLQASHHTKG